ncbi:MAG: ARMT1-like domain-containing protein, partial [Bacteroidales bacterium]|nr:ARMT1-like domain-containing protein [Bacteroidales bacterium]
IDHTGRMREELRKAQRVLYIGDNAGEIVFDKLLITEMSHPGLTFSVRGAPAINDATMEDAEYVGMTGVTRVISSGYDAPTTVVSRSGDVFRRYYEDADLIISKGQGNLEGLIGEHDRRIYFLLMVKCDVIAEYLGVKKGSYVVYNDVIAKTENSK